MPNVDTMSLATADKACIIWREAAMHGTVRVTPTGRLAHIAHGSTAILKNCPWCMMRFYALIGKTETLTFEGWSHRRAAEHAGRAAPNSVFVRRPHGELR